MTHPKRAARTLRALLAADGLNPLGQQRALDVIAALHGTDWNTISARPGHPRLRDNAAITALQAALARHDVTITRAWAAATLTHLYPPAGESGAARRDEHYLPSGLHGADHPRAAFRLRSAPPAQPWPLLPLPASLPAAVHDQLTRGTHLEWTPAGLRVDHVPVPLPINGPDWLSALQTGAPGTQVHREHDQDLTLTRVTYTRPQETDARLTYAPRTPFAHHLMRRAHQSLDLSYAGALHLARQACAYDTFIEDTGVHPRGPLALTEHQRAQLHELERQVLPGRQSRIRDHISEWRRGPHALLTYEPYLSPDAAEQHPDTAAFRERGWTVTLRASAYAPGQAVMLLLEPPTPDQETAP